jgi:hypothetical protein
MRSQCTAIPTPQDKAGQYLDLRGITQGDPELRKMGIEKASSNQLSYILKYTVPKSCSGLVFHYPDTDYATAKILTGPKDWLGQRCPSGVTPHLFIPPGVKLEGKLYLCESPLKALILANYFGLNAVAVGGVYCYYMACKKLWCIGFPHAEIESGAITEVTVAFDSDTEGGINEQVARAVRTIANQLIGMHPSLDGAVIKHWLPAPPADTTYGGKWGIDDAYATWKHDKFEEWLTNPECDQVLKPNELQQHLDDLYSLYTACMTPPAMIHNDTGEMFTPHTFKTFVEANRVATVMSDKGPKQISAAGLFIKQPDRPQVSKLVYSPGREPRYDGKLNLWKDDGVLAVSGDTKPWLEFLENAIPHTVSREQLHATIALKMQNRGTKIKKCIHLYGQGHGEGKTTFTEVIADIIGDSNSVQIDFTDLGGNFNSIWAKREFVVIDDAPEVFYNKVTKMRKEITTNTAIVNGKNVPEYEVRDYKLIAITSNEPNSIKINEGERRYICAKFEPNISRNGDEKYWQELYHWLDKEQGRGIVRHYYESLNVSDWEVDFFPRNTDVIAQTADASKDDVEMAMASRYQDYFVDGKPWEEAPGTPMIMTSNMIASLMGSGWYRSGEMSKILSKAQFKQPKQNNGRPLQLTNARKTVWILHPDAENLSKEAMEKIIEKTHVEIPLTNNVGTANSTRY